MKFLPGREAMQQVEAYSIQQMGLPSLVLMERAALALADAVAERATPSSQVLFCCGSGNNGADGLAAVRLLFQRGITAEVLLVGNPDKSTKEFQTQYEIIQKIGLLCRRTSEEGLEYIKKGNYDVIVDAMFGIGLTRPLRGVYEAVARQINLAGAYVIAVDLPSGVDAETGAVLSSVVKADMTVTFGYEKLGTALYPGKDFAGEVRVCEIGLFDVKPSGRRAFTYEGSDLSCLPARKDHSNKGTYGKVLMVAGSVNMSGAAFLSAKAAYRSGAGLVRILTPEENREILQKSLPEAILTTYSRESVSETMVKECCNWADAIVLGPGLGQEAYVKDLVSLVLSSAKVPTLVDADALNAIAKYKELESLLSASCIVTPHLGEMSRLVQKTVKQVQEELVDTAIEYSRRTGAVCVLKDARTVVSDGNEEFYLNTSGNHGMATAGSGDVLTGIIGAFLAADMVPAEAATLGVYIHSLAGDAAAKRVGKRGLMASDLIESLAEVTGELGDCYV